MRKYLPIYAHLSHTHNGTVKKIFHIFIFHI